VPGNLHAAILKDSHLDIADIPHSTTLPNLELFANAGYPFTREADLGETTVVLPDQPSAAELEIFLTLMAHFGSQTGYPGVRVNVTNSAGMSNSGNGDYLVIGTARDQPALQRLGQSLPIQVGENGFHENDTQDFLDRSTWWKRWAGHTPSGQIDAQGGMPDALIEGMEWPARSNRSLVAIILRDTSAAPAFLSAFSANSQTSAISQSVAVLHGAQFTSYRLGHDAYRVGQISFLTRLTNTFEAAFWLIALLTILICFLMAALIQAMVRRHARKRLQGAQE
jgi:cellulose synthase (UDP-forming)